jgi:hypothetical protein
MVRMGNHEEALETLNKINEILQDEALTCEQRKEFESHAALLSGTLMSGWLPYGIKRRLLMIGIILLGIYGILFENYGVFVWWLLLPAFSPRIVGEITIFYVQITRFFK